MVYSFYFLCFGSRRNECNSLFGERRGRGRKVVAYSDTVSAMLSMMIRWYCQLPLYTINSPLYCSNISFFSRDIFRICDKGDFFNIYIFGKWQSTFSLLLVKSEKIIFWRYIFRASRNLSDLFPLSLPDTIEFIPSGANTQKIKRIDHRNCIMWERVNKIPWQKYLPNK